MGGGAFSGLFDERFCGLQIARFDERFHLMLGAYVIGWTHVFHVEFFGDDPDGVTFLPKCEQRLCGDIGTVFRVHRVRVEWGEH